MTIDVNETKEKIDASSLNDLPLTLESPGFAADEMTACAKCGRSNPPTRLKCFYCGADIAVAEKYAEHVRPTLRKLEEWEKGFNVVFVKRGGTGPDLRSIAGEVGLDPSVLGRITAGSAPMPLARVETEREAALIVERLTRSGIECSVVSDEKLDPGTPPKRLRGIEFTGDSITVTDFNTAEKAKIGANDLVIIVIGQLFALKTHSFEKRKKGKSKVIAQSDASSDEGVIDIYTRETENGFRIYESGFDFSCLAGEKSLLAADNFPKLIRRMSEMARSAKIVDTYLSVRDALDAVWELSSHKDFEGLRRSGFGKADFGNTLTVNNHAQFARFSRMQRQLI